jgi:cytochrome c biogenesis factor
VLATIFTGSGGFESAQAYVDGLIPAVWVGAAALAVGAVVALLVPGKRVSSEVVALAPASDGQVREAVAA